MARDAKDLEALVLVRVVRLNAVVAGMVTGLLAASRCSSPPTG